MINICIKNPKQENMWHLVPVSVGGGPASELLGPCVGGVPGGGGHEGGVLRPQDRAGGLRPRHHAGLQVSRGLERIGRKIGTTLI